MIQTKNRQKSQRNRQSSGKKTRKRLVRATVAGGVVFAKIDGRTKILLIQHPLNHQWSLPKGHVEAQEPVIVAAKREILEETGVETEVLEFLNFSNIWSSHDKYHLLRRFHAYLFKAVGSTKLDPAKFDPEENMVRDARWMTFEEADKKVPYKNLKPILRQAGERITEIGRG